MRNATRQPPGLELSGLGDSLSFPPQDTIPPLCATLKGFKNTVTIPSLEENRKDFGPWMLSSTCESHVPHLSVLLLKNNESTQIFRFLYIQGRLCHFWSQNKLKFCAKSLRRQDPFYMLVRLPRQAQRFLYLKADLYTTKWKSGVTLKAIRTAESRDLMKLCLSCRSRPMPVLSWGTDCLSGSCRKSSRAGPSSLLTLGTWLLMGGGGRRYD